MKVLKSTTNKDGSTQLFKIWIKATIVDQSELNSGELQNILVNEWATN